MRLRTSLTFSAILLAVSSCGEAGNPLTASAEDRDTETELPPAKPANGTVSELGGAQGENVSELPSEPVALSPATPVGAAPAHGDTETGDSNTEDTPGSATTSDDSGDVVFGAVSVPNTDGHNDPVDLEHDTSWIEAATLDSGHSMLRLLMTDAPVDADSVFVTFCGIHVDAASDDADSDDLETISEPQLEPGTVEVDDQADMAELDAEEPDDQLNVEEPEGEMDGEDSVDEADGEVPEGEMDGEELDGELDSVDEADLTEPDDELNVEEAGDELDAGAPAALLDEPSLDDGSDVAAAPSSYVMADTCRTLDLLDLQNGVTEALGIMNLPAGDYSQLRLMLVDATIVVDGEEHDLFVPSGSESGLKVVGGFHLEEGTATTLTIDFDALQSVHYAPGRGYMLKPVIHLAREKKHDKPEKDARADMGNGGADDDRGADRAPSRADSADRSERPERGDAAEPGSDSDRGEDGEPRNGRGARDDAAADERDRGQGAGQDRGPDDRPARGEQAGADADEPRGRGERGRGDAEKPSEDLEDADLDSPTDVEPAETEEEPAEVEETVEEPANETEEPAEQGDEPGTVEPAAPPRGSGPPPRNDGSNGAEPREPRPRGNRD